jgi:hypothetical protein
MHVSAVSFWAVVRPPVTQEAVEVRIPPPE